MKEDKIEIMAQPTTKVADSEVKDTAISKLQNLIDTDLKQNSDVENQQSENVTDKSPKNSPEDSPSDVSEEYDEDGFKVPIGKIPLDGQFSDSELKELISLAKKEGLLNKDIKVRVTECNSISKRLEIVQPRLEAE